jgi:hypothetical protein
VIVRVSLFCCNSGGLSSAAYTQRWEIGTAPYPVALQRVSEKLGFCSSTAFEQVISAVANASCLNSATKTQFPGYPLNCNNSYACKSTWAHSLLNSHAKCYILADGRWKYARYLHVRSHQQR